MVRNPEIVYKAMRKTSAIIRLAEILPVVLFLCLEFASDMNVLRIINGGIGSALLILLILCILIDFFLTIAGIFSNAAFCVHFALSIAVSCIVLLMGVYGIALIILNIFPFALYFYRKRSFDLLNSSEKEKILSKYV